MMPPFMALKVAHDTTPEKASFASLTNNMNGILWTCAVPHLHDPMQHLLNIHLAFIITSDFQAQVSVN